MRLTTLLGVIFRPIAVLFGAPQRGHGASAAGFEAGEVASVATVVPAVAGYVLRFEDIRQASGRGDAAYHEDAGGVSSARINAALRTNSTDFMLSARLASVAVLNVKNGRKPRISGKSKSAMPPVPVARMSAKKRRGAVTGCRVHRPAPVRSSARIIPFPAGRSTSSTGAARSVAAA